LGVTFTSLAGPPWLCAPVVITSGQCLSHLTSNLKLQTSNLKRAASVGILAAYLLTSGMNWTQIIGLTAGILTASSLLPQLIKTLKEKKAEDVSIGMLLILQAGVAMWVVYGFMRDDLPIIVTNCFSLALNIAMTVARIKYKH
jgi:MtN3 and saliva related transmembrane protein